MCSPVLELVPSLCCYSKMKREFASWSDVRVFLAVLRSGSTLAASKRLGMSQPTVARRIDALEHALGLVLFERDTRGVRPTADAARLIEPAQAMEAAANALTKEAGRAPTEQTIRITAPVQSFSARFAGILSDFGDLHPGTRFELVSSPDILDLVAGEADVALRFTQEIGDDRLICTKLTEVKSALYASPGYVERCGKPASEDDLGEHSFVVLDTFRTSFTINDWLIGRVRPDQIVSRGSNIEAIVTAVQAGLGIGPIPKSLAADHPTLILCVDTPDNTAVPSWLLVAPDAYRRPEVRAFSAFFARRFRKMFEEFR